MNTQVFKAKIADLKQKWYEIDPNKRNFILAAIGVLIITVFVLMADGQKKQAISETREKRLNSQVTKNGVVAPKVGEVGVAELKGLTQSELERQRQQQEAIMQNQQAIATDYQTGTQVINQSVSDLSQQVASLSDELNAMKLGREGGTSNIGLPPLPTIDPNVESVQQQQQQDNPMQQQPVDQQQYLPQQMPVATPTEVVTPREAEPDPFRIIRSDKNVQNLQSSGYTQNNTPPKQESVQAKLLIERGLTTGSILTGVLINGMDAASGRGQSSPVPALVRIKANAILPNRYTQAVKECFVLVSGVANMASERVDIRGEKIACIFKDGKVIDGPLSAYIVGEDGRAGLKGRKVTKNGSTLAKVIVASTLSGLGKQLAPSQVPSINISSGGNVQYETPDIGNASKVAAATGAGNALDRLANYYMDIADQRMDVLEVDAGRKVTLILSNSLSGAK